MTFKKTINNYTKRSLTIFSTITNREIKSLDHYLRDISNEPHLTPDQEVAHAQAIHKGDENSEAAVEKLARANLRFVVTVAKQYQNSGLPLPDLINEGNLGLLDAARKIDETRGFKFISYAVWWIRQSILHAVNDHARMVRHPANQQNELNKEKKAAARLEQALGHTPTTFEMAEFLNIPEGKVKNTLSISSRVVSIDTPVNTDEESTLIDVLPDATVPPTDSHLMYESLCTDIDRALNILSTEEKDIVKKTFGLGIPHPLTLDEIALEYNVTRERIRQIKDKGIKRLKNSTSSAILRQYI